MLCGPRQPGAERRLLIETAVLLANAVATLVMVGLIWFVQVVHYPLLAGVSVVGMAEHQRLTGYVVAGPMAVEAASAGLLLFVAPDGVSGLQAGLGLGLVAVIWLSTALLQVPRHRALAGGTGDARRLVRDNWVRTIAWTARGAIVVWMLATATG